MFIFTVWKEEVLSRSQAQDQELTVSRSGVRLVSVHECGVGGGVPTCVCVCL